ncbi:MAG: formate dehydrogenase subunit gamma [Pseudomonadota bacterium]
MQMIKILMAITFVVFLGIGGSQIIAVDNAYAQTSDTESVTSGDVPGGTTSGSSSDSELWRQIREGNTGNVVGQDKSGGIMIQSQGQEWREIRNGLLPRYSAISLLGILFLLSIFFAIRGRIKIEHGRSNRTLTRFSMLERASHWLLASSFIILAITGLNLIFGKDLLIPIMGPEAFATFTVFGKYVHNYVGFAFMVAVFMVAVLWIVHNIPNRHDLMWILRAGGMLGGGHPPARKFNAGQKIIFWIVILCGVSISMSGWALLNPFTTTMFADTFAISNNLFGTEFPTTLAPIQEQQYQTLWHAIMAVFMIVVIIAQIYIGSVGMEGAIDAMTTGEVDENWAMEHHSLWVEEMDNANATEQGAKAQPAE